MFFKTLVLCLFLSLTLGSEVKRVKRAKYFSYPSRFYRKPPPPHFVQGPFSYTPPPNYMQDNEPMPPYRPKVSKKTNDGLGDEDINNLVKYLSKKDLDKIVEYAGEKDRRLERYRDDSSEIDNRFKRPERNAYKNDDIEQFVQNIQYFKDAPVQQNNANMKARNLYPKPQTILDENPNSNLINDASQFRIIYTNPQESSSKFVYTNQEAQFSNNIQHPNYQHNLPPLHPNTIVQYSNNLPKNTNAFQSTSQEQYFNTPADKSESMHQFVSYVTVPPNYADILYTDSNTMKEEPLPKPLNLREDDYEAANTNNVPKIVPSEMYKVENFMDLPLMNYDSKLHTVSSYHVPHYLVTSTKSQQSSKPSTSGAVQIEKAPEGDTGKEQSDAHLKAVKIWTHRSKGTAYTLHDDGTLSLEKPRVKTNYGHVE